MYCKQNSDRIAQGSDDADCDLNSHGFGNVDLWPRYFFRQMGDEVRCPYCVGSIEHAHEENEAIGRISDICSPIPEDKSGGCMRGSSTRTRHSCADDNRDKKAGEHEEQGKVVEYRNGTIGKEHHAAGAPCDNEVAYEDMPRLGTGLAVTHSGKY